MYRKGTSFDVELAYDFGNGDEPIRVTGTISPYYPAVMYLRNGDPGYPAEGGDIEDWRIFRYEGEGKKQKEVEVADDDGKILDVIQDAIYEKVWRDSPDY